MLRTHFSHPLTHSSLALLNANTQPGSGRTRRTTFQYSARDRYISAALHAAADWSLCWFHAGSPSDIFSDNENSLGLSPTLSVQARKIVAAVTGQLPIASCRYKPTPTCHDTEHKNVPRTPPIAGELRLTRRHQHADH